ATYLGESKCQFLVWAPFAERVELKILPAGDAVPQASAAPGASPDRVVELQRFESGYHGGQISGVGPGNLYMYRLDAQKERPDPASRSQPYGVHGPSEVISEEFDWADANWGGIALEDYL